MFEEQSTNKFPIYTTCFHYARSKNLTPIRANSLDSYMMKASLTKLENYQLESVQILYSNAKSGSCGILQDEQ